MKPRRDYVIGDKNKSFVYFKKIEIIPSIFSDNGSIKLESTTEGKLKNSQIC